MKVILVLDGDVNSAFSDKFAELKNHVPDNRDFLYFFFKEKMSLDTFLKDKKLFSLHIQEDGASITVKLDPKDVGIIEFILNLKKLSMLIGGLLLNFEEELKSDPYLLNSFIKKHDLQGFDLENFYLEIRKKNYDTASKVVKEQYESLKKSFYVLFTDRYKLLDLHKFI